MKRIKPDTQKPALSFYTALPHAEMNYELFKGYATDRIKLLRRIENNIDGSYAIKTMEEDLTGHACLMLICSHVKWLSTWFISMETLLFKSRLEKNTAEAERFFLEKVWPHMAVEADSGAGDACIGYTTHFDAANYNDKKFSTDIKVHFSKCSELLFKRNHRLVRGYLPFCGEVMRAMLVSEFRRCIAQRVELLTEQLRVNPDERLEQLAAELFMEGGKTSEATKDVLARERLFPLCMRGLMQKLATQKHLKYNDRQALCLFLKDLGLPLNDALQFFRSRFGCTPDQFNKEYLYNIRHNYGLEGKRANYSSFTCSKLIGITSDPNSFGCPFIKNTEYVRQFTDIEDFGRDALKCCRRLGEADVGHGLDGHFATPAEYFRLIDKALEKPGEE